MPMICTTPPSAIETVVELFNEDRLAHPHIPHVFAIPHLITHLWRKILPKDADVLFTVNVGPYLSPCSMHEPLIVLIAFHLDHVPNYRGTWVLRGSPPSFGVQNQPEAGFKHPELHGCGKSHDLEGPMHGV